MVFATNSASLAWVTETMSILVRILLILATLFVALLIGLLLRRQVIRRLGNTVLDNWIIHTLAVAVVLLPFVFAIPISTFIWDVNLLYQFWSNIQTHLQLKNVDFVAIIWDVALTLLLAGLGIGIARTIQALTIRRLGENRIDINIRTLIGRVCYITILTIIIFWILSIWQLPLTLPVTALGVLTVAITVSVQDVLKNLFAGFYILLERPFHIGDEISTNSAPTYTGTVEDVQLRATQLRLLSGEQVTIPNSFIFGNIVVNNTFYGERRATISIVIPEEDFVKDETPERVVAAVKELQDVVPKPEPTVLLSNYAEKKITLTLRFWVASRPHTTVSEVMHTLHNLLPGTDLMVIESAGDI